MVSLASGPSLQVPAGAVTNDTTITVSQATTTAPSGAMSALYKFEPEGTTFEKPIEVSFDVPAGTSNATVYWTKQGDTSTYQSLPTVINGTKAVAWASHFSLGFVGKACTEGASCSAANGSQGMTTCSSGAPVCVTPNYLSCVGSAPIDTAAACTQLPSTAFNAQETLALKILCTTTGGTFAQAACPTSSSTYGSLLGTCNFPYPADGAVVDGIASPIPVGMPITVSLYSSGLSLATAYSLCTAASGTLTQANGQVCTAATCGGTSTAGGTTSTGGSCSVSDASGGLSACIDWSSTFGASVQSACSSAGGTYSTSSCSTAGRIGTCTLTYATGAYSVVESFYGSSTSASTLQSACTAATQSGVTATWTSYSTPPPAMVSNVAAAPGANSAFLSWSPAGGASSYNVYYDTTPTLGASSSKATVSTSSAAITGLANGFTYYFAVTAVNAGGESPLSTPVSATPNAAMTGLTLYDMLTAAELDGRKWQGPGAFAVGVADGAAVLSVDVTDMPSRTVRNDTYSSVVSVSAGTHRVTTIKADVTVPAATAARSGGAQLRAPVRLLYSPPAYRLNFPGANLDLLLLEVGLIETDTGLYAYRHVSHCDDASCATNSATGITVVDPIGFATIAGLNVGAPAAFDTTYTVTASLDESTGVFHWTIAGGSFGTGVSGSADPAAYLSTTPGWSVLGPTALAGVGFQGAQIGVRAIDTSTSGGGSGKITARFGNVWVGLDNALAAPFDDFSGTNGNSGPTELSMAKWGNGGSRSIGMSGGGAIIHNEITGNVANTSSFQGLVLADPASANTLQADVSVPATITPASSLISYIQGKFYNDGTVGTTAPNVNETNSAMGDIMAHVILNSTSNTVTWGIVRCTNSSCSLSGQTTLGFGTFSGLTVGTGVHTLRLKWDPAAKLFTFTADGTSITVDPQHVVSGGVSQAAPYVKPANAPIRAILSGVTVNAGVTGSVTTKVNNVFTAP